MYTCVHSCIDRSCSVDLKKVQSFETNEKVWLRILVGWGGVGWTLMLLGHDLLLYVHVRGERGER